MEKIITINNQQYKIDSEAILTPEQLNKVVEQLSNKKTIMNLSCSSGIQVTADSLVPLTADNFAITYLDLRLVSEPTCTTGCTCSLTISQAKVTDVIVDVKIKNNNPTSIGKCKLSVNLLRNGIVVLQIPMEGTDIYETTRCMDFGGRDEVFITSSSFKLPETLGTYTVAINTKEAVYC